MDRANLKERVASLESQVEKLAGQMRAADNGRRGKSWQRAVEKYAGDSDLQSVLAEALKLREADRKRTKRAPPPAARKQR